MHQSVNTGYAFFWKKISNIHVVITLLSQNITFSMSIKDSTITEI